MNEKREMLFQFRSDTKEWSFRAGAMEIGESFEETESPRIV